MEFLRNTWYAAFWAQELKPGKLYSRTILSEPLVAFRKEDGTFSALTDICPHRFVPLHLGKLLPGDRIRCGYHGLEFEASGSCVHNPHGEGRIPANMRARSYPMIEKHSIVWIWMGDGPADESKIPDFSVMEDGDELVRGRDYIKIDANYLLLADNLLDLTHANYLHEGILGLPAHSDAKITVEQRSNSRLYTGRIMKNVPIARLHDLLFRRDGEPIDMWNDITWDAPGCLILTHGFARPDQPKTEGFEFRAVHLLTPESETATHYLYGIARPPVHDDSDVQKEVAETRRYVFEEQDKVVLEAQQRMFESGRGSSMKPVMLPIDAASMRMRRLLDALIASERNDMAAVGVEQC